MNLPTPSTGSEPAPTSAFQRLMATILHEGQVARDMLIAPQRAFAAIAAGPTWWFAYGVTVVLGLAAVMLEGPAVWHVLVLAVPELRHLRPGDLSDRAQIFFVNQGLQVTIVQFVDWGLTAVVLALFAPRDVVPRRLATFFSLCVNANIASAIGMLLASIAIALRAPESFSTIGKLALALPDNLALIAPAGTLEEVDFLSHFDVFSFWTYGLIGLGYAVIAKTAPWRGLAISFSCALVLTLYHVRFG